MEIEDKGRRCKVLTEMHGKKLFEQFMRILSDPDAFLLETVCYKDHSKEKSNVSQRGNAKAKAVAKTKAARPGVNAHSVS